MGLSAQEALEVLCLALILIELLIDSRKSLSANLVIDRSVCAPHRARVLVISLLLLQKQTSEIWRRVQTQAVSQRTRATLCTV